MHASLSLEEAGELTEHFIQEFAGQIRIPAGIVVGRLQHDNAISFGAGSRQEKRLLGRELRTVDRETRLSSAIIETWLPIDEHPAGT